MTHSGSGPASIDSDSGNSSSSNGEEKHGKFSCLSTPPYSEEKPNSTVLPPPHWHSPASFSPSRLSCLSCQDHLQYRYYYRIFRFEKKEPLAFTAVVTVYSKVIIEHRGPVQPTDIICSNSRQRTNIFYTAGEEPRGGTRCHTMKNKQAIKKTVPAPEGAATAKGRRPSPASASSRTHPSPAPGGAHLTLSICPRARAYR